MMKKYFMLPYLKWGLWIGVSFLWIFIFVESYNHGDFLWGHAIKETGGLAWKCLMFTIFVSLFQKLFPKMSFFAKMLPLRKHTGIFAFLVGFSHIFVAFFKFGWAKAVSVTMGSISLTFGAIAFLVMLPAFITSTNWACKKMGFRAWKNIQRLAHLAFVFTVLHLAFLKFSRNGIIDFEAFVPLLVYLMGYGYLFYRRFRLKTEKLKN